jgi:Aspartyl protease
MKLFHEYLKIACLLPVLFLLDSCIHPEKDNTMSLEKFLISDGYVKLQLMKSNTGHLALTALINGIEGYFILDTGAGGTVIDEKQSKRLKMHLEENSITGAGAGGTGLKVWSSRGNKIALQDFHIDDFDLSAMDLKHVNEALSGLGEKVPDGVIGADILNKGNAIIDYPKKVLYLKM